MAAFASPPSNNFLIESTLGTQNEIDQSGQGSAFAQDLNKIMGAAYVVTSNPTVKDQ